MSRNFSFHCESIICKGRTRILDLHHITDNTWVYCYECLTYWQLTKTGDDGELKNFTWKEAEPHPCGFWNTWILEPKEPHHAEYRIKVYFEGKLMTLETAKRERSRRNGAFVNSGRLVGGHDTFKHSMSILYRH